MKKKANLMMLLIVVGGLFLLVIFGVMMVIGSSVLNWLGDETVPVLRGIGVVGDSNMTEIADMTIVPLNTFIQNFTWLAGVVYVFGLIALFGLAYSYRFTGERWMIPLFFIMVFLLVIGCIVLSNVYEDVYDNTDDFALIMQEHILLSYLIIYSPAIMSIIAFISGILMFSGGREVFP